MTRTDVREFLNQHCRFKLRSGKVVFGVIWEVSNGGETEYYFISAGEHDMLVRDPQLKNQVFSARVELDEIVGAERLVS
jgi:hypothetical protein